MCSACGAGSGGRGPGRRPNGATRGAAQRDASRRRAGESSEAPHGKALSWYLAGGARSSLAPWSLPLPLLRKRNDEALWPTQFAVLSALSPRHAQKVRAGRGQPNSKCSTGQREARAPSAIWSESELRLESCACGSFIQVTKREERARRERVDGDGWMEEDAAPAVSRSHSLTQPCEAVRCWSDSLTAVRRTSPAAHQCESGL